MLTYHHLTAELSEGVGSDIVQEGYIKGTPVARAGFDAEPANIAFGTFSRGVSQGYYLMHVKVVTWRRLIPLTIACLPTLIRC